MKNPWLLILKGKDGFYTVNTYARESIARQESKRYEKENVFAIVINLDTFITEQPGVTQ